jgi:hypothetical protein
VQQALAFEQQAIAEAACTSAVADAEAASTKAAEDRDRCDELLRVVPTILTQQAAAPTNTTVLVEDIPTPNLSLTAAVETLQAQLADGRATQAVEAQATQSAEAQAAQTASVWADHIANCPEPHQEFRDLWKEESIKLGCSVQEAISYPFAEQDFDHPFAEQDFEHGFMFWYGEADSDLYFAIVADPRSETCTTWYTSRSSPVTWEGTEGLSCTPTPPAPNLRVPIRGFGSLWCNHSGVRDALGYATDVESWADDNILQEFDNGYMLLDSRNKRYILFRDDSSCVVESH